jgi:methylene-tetrahydromethanopterin dehydrogenase
VLLAAAPPACRIIKSEHMGSSELLTVVADTNAEPPSGVEGIEPGMNRGQIPGSIALGIGPLAIARMRHKIECQLLMQMLSSQACRPSGLWDVLTFAQRLPV